MSDTGEFTGPAGCPVCNRPLKDHWRGKHCMTVICPYCDQPLKEDEYWKGLYFGRPVIYPTKNHLAICVTSERYLAETKEFLEKNFPDKKS